MNFGRDLRSRHAADVITCAAALEVYSSSLVKIAMTTIMQTLVFVLTRGSGDGESVRPLVRCEVVDSGLGPGTWYAADAGYPRRLRGALQCCRNQINTCTTQGTLVLKNE